jgi:peptidoglycan glycosyltransferase
VDDPDIVISVIVEDYTTNQTSGTYVASKVFDAYYNNTNQ